MDSNTTVTIAFVLSITLLVYIIYRLKGNWKNIWKEIIQLKKIRYITKVILSIIFSIPLIIILFTLLISAYILILDILHFKGYISIFLVYFLAFLPIGIWIFDLVKTIKKK